MAGVEATREGAVLTIRLDRPEAGNALDARMHADLEASLEHARDPDVRAVVLTGAGSSFCSGHDPAELVRRPYEKPVPAGERLGRHVLALRALEKPVVAAINGPALGPGLTLALACDVRIAADNAVLEPGWGAAGLAPDGGASWLLRRALGGPRAFEWLATGHRIGAAEALDRGLVSELVPADRLDVRAAEVAAHLAALPTRAVWEAKRLLDVAETETLAGALALEARAQAELSQTPDAAEAALALREAREPRFDGSFPADRHPIRLVVDDDLRRFRLTVCLRWLLVLPHLAVLVGWLLLAQYVAIAAWAVTLVRGRLPDGLHGWLGRAVRYSTHVTAYAYLVADPYPTFRGWPGGYPIDLEIDPPTRQNRWTVAFRLVLAIPAFVLANVLAWVLAIVAFAGFVVATMIGRMPRGMRDLMAYCLRYQAQTYAYLFLLTGRYPSLASGGGFAFEEATTDVRARADSPGA